MDQAKAHKKVDYLIIGQGLVGTWLSYYVLKAGKTCMVVNDSHTAAASQVASGVINPVTGRRIVQTWMIDTFLPFALKAYTDLGAQLNTTIVKEAPVFLIHPSLQMQESFEYRYEHDNVYLQKNNASDFEAYMHTPFGTGQINQTIWIDLNLMITGWRQQLINNTQYIDAKFDIADLQITNEGVSWNEIQANRILFCDGIASMENSYFKMLPFAPNKGEALIVEIKDLPNQAIYKNNMTIVPWKDQLFWVGSNYDWEFTDTKPSIDFRNKMEMALRQLLKIPFIVVDHIAGIRPANQERRPFVGLHPSYPAIGICNGMGTKGCSLAPYFAHQLIAHCEQGSPIHPEASLERFEQILKK
ncbi:MAG: NAD(P)/FAD-dependent oxidoreductase [Chitinophagia bacterium]